MKVLDSDIMLGIPIYIHIYRQHVPVGVIWQSIQSKCNIDINTICAIF